MEPILEEDDSDLYIDILQDSSRDLALKSGYLTLQERLQRWHSRNRVYQNDGQRSENRHRQKQATAGQFANLHEFFQSKSSFKKQLEQEAQMRAEKRPKMPIMKLSKEDWNVKCWEQRARPLRWAFLRSDSDNQLQDLNVNHHSNNRLQKPELQVKVFNGRVDEVAKKLEKVRVGLPLDEQMYKLEMNRLLDQRREHSWTDQLKKELSQGTHDRKVLKLKIMEQQAADKRSDSKNVVSKSVLGRPIRRLFDDDDD